MSVGFAFKFGILFVDSVLLAVLFSFCLNLRLLNRLCFYETINGFYIYANNAIGYIFLNCQSNFRGITNVLFALSLSALRIIISHYVATVNVIYYNNETNIKGNVIAIWLLFWAFFNPFK